MFYASFEFYKNKCGDKSVDEKVFDALMSKASAYIDRETFGRIGKDPPECVKLAACALIDCLDTWGSTDGVTAERVGEYSVSYGGINAKGGTLTLHERMYDVLCDYLSNTDLLYRGVRA